VSFSIFRSLCNAAEGVLHFIIELEMAPSLQCNKHARCIKIKPSLVTQAAK